MSDTLALYWWNPLVERRYQSFIHPKVDQETINYLSNKDNISYLTNYDANIITELQNKFKDVFNLKYVIATNSWTSAIFEMFHAVGLQPWDEVIVPIYTFFATATPLFAMWCIPVPADCWEDWNIDPEDVKRKVSSKTKAVIVTHMRWLPCKMDELLDICHKNNIPLLEDSSHAHGAIYKWKIIWSFSDCSAWSLSSKKIITWGQGWIFWTNDQELYEKTLLFWHANNKRMNDIHMEKFSPYAISWTGLNLRMHPYSAYMIYQQLNQFEEQMAQRRIVADYLTKELSNIPWLTLPIIEEWNVSAHYAFPIFYDERFFKWVSKETFIKALNAEWANEADIPVSTCPLTTFEMFRKWRIDFDQKFQDMYTIEQFPWAIAYQKKMFKIPSRYGEDALWYAKSYINAIHKVVKCIDELS